MLGFIGAVSLMAVAGLWVVTMYNGFIRLRTRSEEAWSGIGVQLKRRYDLIPNLVETVKGYAKHEKNVFEQVAQSRVLAMGASDLQTQASAENALTASLKSLFAIAEAYPELKANQNFMELQKSLGEVEDQIQYARRYYNAVVRDLNILCESFPSVLIANFFKFTKQEYFEIADNEKARVDVGF